MDRMLKKLCLKSLALALGLSMPVLSSQAQGVVDTTSTGSSRIYLGDTIEKYPTVNLKNSFTGVIPGLFVTEKSGMTGLRYNWENCILTIRGTDTRQYIVDGVILDQPSEIQLGADEIESITLVSDVVDKLRFGPSVSDGAVYIKTLKGMPRGRSIRFGVESGVDLVDRFPAWVTGVDYARLNNQARTNSGYETLFTPQDMDWLKYKDPYSLTHPNVDWKNLLVRDFRTMTKANFSIRGGGERVRYAGSLSYANHGDIYKVTSNAYYNRLNAKMNLEVDVNDWIGLEFNFLAGYTSRLSPFSSYKGRSTPYEMPTLMSLVTTVPSTEFPIYLDVNPETGKYNYAVTQKFGTHPYATFAETGYYNEESRSGLTNAKLHLDFSGFAPGLKSETMIAYNIYYFTMKGQSSDYMAYIYDPVTEERGATTHVGDSQSEKSSYGAGYLQDIQFYEKLYWDYAAGGHKVNLAATYLRRNEAASTSSSYNLVQNYIVEAKYNYADKYFVELIGNCAGSSALKRGNRYGFFPAIGAGWIASNEDFLKDSRVVDFLKFRAQAGIIGNTFASENQFLWEGTYSKGDAINFGPNQTTNSDWLGQGNQSSVTTTTVDRYQNHDLEWTRTYELSAGVDMMLFDRLSLGFTYFDRYLDGKVANVGNLLPDFFGVTTRYENALDYRYFGEEFNINWSDRIGDFGYSVGGYLIHQNSILMKGNSSYAYDYLNPEGKSVGAIFGYRYLGKYESLQDIDESPLNTLDNVKVGDLKYADINKDGQVDANDRYMIGNSTPKLLYSISLHLSYRNFDLTLVGTGKAFFDTMLTNEYFWNGWGDNNYSAFVRDNIGGRYPNLSYEKSNNNFVNSSFWMEKGDFFKIQNAEFGYRFDFKRNNRIGISSLRLFLRGANLATFSRIKDVDPEAIDAGVTDYPLFRTVTAGFNVNF